MFADHAPAWAQAAVPGARGVWAPDISYRDGLYHLYYTGRNQLGQVITGTRR